jgi:hypothetical protein
MKALPFYPKNLNKNAQAAIEYLLLLGVVAAIVLGGFVTWISHSKAAANAYFQTKTMEIYGDKAITRETSADAYP